MQPTRPYFRDIPEPWKLARNGDWDSVVIDQTPDDWPAFFAERVVGPLWEKGYRGFFLSTPSTPTGWPGNSTKPRNKPA